MQIGNWRPRLSMKGQVMSRAATIAIAAVLLVVPAVAAAHSGGTDKNGCHVNRATGERHCHGARGSGGGQVPQRATPAPRGAFANCAAARAAGAAPVRRGDPGYGRHLDRDNDGVGCE